MKVNTAIGFVLAGSGLLFLASEDGRRRVAGRIACILCIALGGAIAAEYLLNIDLQIDQLLFRDATIGPPFPGRASPIAVFDFMAIGIAILAARSSSRALRSLSAFFAGTVVASAYLAIVGYVYSIPALYSIGGDVSIALHSAVGFGVLSLATLQMDPDHGVARILYNDEASGFAARWLLPIAALLPLLLGWISLKAQSAGQFSMPGAIGFLVTGMSILLAILVFRLSGSLDRMEATRLGLDKVTHLYGRLTEAYRHLDTMIETSPLAIVEVDRELRVRSWNSAAERMFGWRASEVMGQVLPTISEELLGQLRQLIDTNDPSLHEGGVETKRRHKDGRLIDVSLWTSPRFDKQGKVIGSIGILADMTPLKRAEQNLRNLFESAPDAMILCDEAGRILQVNATAERMFGYPRSELLGRQVETLMPERYREAHPLHRRSFHAAPQARSMGPGFMLYGLRGNGSEFPLEISLSPIQLGEENAVVAAVRDITQRKQVEEQLTQLQRLQAVGQLTSGVAHDFNNLLTVVVGNLEMLNERLDADRKGRSFGEAALAAALRGSELVRQLLAFSRQQPLDTKAVDVNQLVRGTTEMLERLLGDNIEVDVHCAGNLWAVETDPAQLESALVNLGVNARDAMPNGGRLTIETANAALDEAGAQNEGVTPGDYVVVTVADTGVGIPPEQLSRVVEPFFTTKDVGKGSGLGLSMIYGYARQSGGHLRIQSEVDRGTTVRLYLPRGKTELQMAAAEQPQAPAQGSGELILVVDDDAAVRLAVVALLADLGYRTAEAADGASAIELLKATPGVSLLLTDIVMPGGMTGIQLADMARQIRPDIRVLYTSGYIEPSLRDGDTGVPVGNQLLRKPYRKQELAEKLNQALSDDRNADGASRAS